MPSWKDSFDHAWTAMLANTYENATMHFPADWKMTSQLRCIISHSFIPTHVCSLSLPLSQPSSTTAQLSRKLRQFRCTALDDAMADPSHGSAFYCGFLELLAARC